MRQRNGVREDSWLRDQSPVSFLYFVVAIFGFSFWFLMAAPFASHRETYWWLADALTRPLRDQLGSGLSLTYRPIAQSVIWLLFRLLDPSQFPTNSGRQAVIQYFVFALFVAAWWLIYSAARERRLFSVMALVTGGVLFSGYIHLFHIYGMMYVPPMMMLGMLLRFRAAGTLERRVHWLFAAALVLALWHPFVTAFFVACYSGFYLETFKQRNYAGRIVPLLMLAVSVATIIAVIVIFPRDRVPMNSRLAGFIASYRTNEINGMVSAVVFVLTLLVPITLTRSPRKLLAWLVALSVIAAVMFAQGIPVLMLWFALVLVKLFRLRLWSLWLLMLATALLPLGSATGTPMYILFAIIVATYATALGWEGAEDALKRTNSYFIVVPLAVAACLLLLIRNGVQVPFLSRVALPLLSERERTYQMEAALAWLRTSQYCNADIAYAVNAGSPGESLGNAITRRNRPPADIQDVLVFWNEVLRCRRTGETSDASKVSTAVVTFGGPQLTDATPVYEIPGRYGGTATVWITSKPGVYTAAHLKSRD